MKSIVFVLASCLLIPFFSYSQCTPSAATGTPGITPTPANVTCITRGTPYSITMQFENFTSITTPIGAITVDSARIDSLVNFPCGITWQANKRTFLPGETGCIVVSGTTTDAVGQYKLGIYMTMTMTVPFLGQQTQSGEISSLIQTINNFSPGAVAVDVNYFSRVIQGGACPAIDTSSGANNLTASGGATCPVIVLGVSITGNNTVCAGASTNLTANAVNSNGTVSYSWNTGATTSVINVSPTTTTAYSVTVTDQDTTATASATVTVNHSPTAAFSATATGAVATVSNTTAGATTYAWTFGDGSTSALQSPPAHTYNSNGTKTITLIAGNTCGADTATHTVTIVGVGISSVQYDLSFEVYPNPSNGQVALDFSADNSSKSYDLNILDLSGKSVYAEKITAVSGSVQKQLDLSTLPKGVYTLRLSSDKGFGMKKLMLN